MAPNINEGKGRSILLLHRGKKNPIQILLKADFMFNLWTSDNIVETAQIQIVLLGWHAGKTFIFKIRRNLMHELFLISQFRSHRNNTVLNFDTRTLIAEVSCSVWHM